MGRFCQKRQCVEKKIQNLCKYDNDKKMKRQEKLLNVIYILKKRTRKYAKNKEKIDKCDLQNRKNRKMGKNRLGKT